VIDGVKRRRQIEADQHKDLFVVSCSVVAVEDFQQCSFRLVPGPVRRLVLTEVGRAEQVRSQSRQHQPLQNLGNGRQIGNWSVVAW